jgi:hypothetical protein
MLQAERSSAAVKSGANVALQAAAADHGWRESILVLLVVLAPIGLAAIAMAIGLAARAAWQIAHAVSLELPAPATIRLYGLLSYALGSWIAVAWAWLWSTRREMRRDVFIFRRLTWPALTASIVGFGIVMLGVPVVTHWLTHVSGGRSQEVRLDFFHDARSVAIVVFLFTVTTPVSEEILYRGLLVAWLRRVGWRDFTILLVGSVLFAANHIIPLGYVWGVAMIPLGVILFALRIRFESLSPALFNAQLTLFYPLIASLVPASYPLIAWLVPAF